MKFHRTVELYYRLGFRLMDMKHDYRMILWQWWSPVGQQVPAFRDCPEMWTSRFSRIARRGGVHE